MTGTTFGIAVLGTLFAVVHGGTAGLRAEMFARAAMQLAVATGATGATGATVSVQHARQST